MDYEIAARRALVLIAEYDEYDTGSNPGFDPAAGMARASVIIRELLRYGTAAQEDS